MPTFSANLGFLWQDLPLPDAIRAAAKAGFDAVECHWPFDQDKAAIIAALDDTALAMQSLNTAAGDSFGLAAMAGHKAEARGAIDQALGWATALGCPNVHVMAGIAQGRQAAICFEENLIYACDQAQRATTGNPITNTNLSASATSVLIEPINGADVPGYFLASLEQAADIIQRLNRPALKLMFDCYHVQRIHGDVIGALERYADIIGHIQFAGVPTRQEPDCGALDYAPIFRKIDAMGWQSPLGAEYKPRTSVEAGLGWLKTFRTPTAIPQNHNNN